MGIKQREDLCFYLEGQYTTRKSYELISIEKWIKQNNILADIKIYWQDELFFSAAYIYFFNTNDAMRFKLRWG